ncbi:kielin/chordin-like protein [Macrobrachium nipponense]|uniref:kielin/chordin-like protein n=1 Tax=Macrobrachium nipponense TaxID=159736 RepID=UPI0030C81482
MTCQPVTCPKVPCTHPAKRHGACCPDCQHGCIYDSYIVPEGETVEDVNDTCTECLCTRGSLVCGPVVCPELTCSDPVHKPGECCAFCNSCDGAEEGDTWQPDPCTHCQCKQGEQLCYSLGCSPPACHNPARPQGECCPVCHHCDYQGHHIMNGDSKVIAPCITCSCNLGTVTCQSEECGPPVCLHPESIPGECCPRCPGQCSYDDRVIATGSTFQPSFNPCLNCSCQKCSCDSGVITCTGETCQKCPYGVPVPGSCCPDCSRCFVGGQLVDNKVWFNRGGDPCEPCQCLDGSLKCRPRTTCPELSCLLKHRPDGECCPVCIGCIDDRGQTWDEGQHWTLESDPCQQCQCHKNLITCARAQCQVYCSHPVPPAPSTCCPTCEACLYRSKIYAQDERIPTTDPCSECYCKNGSLVCYTQSCKPVYCTNAQIRPGECCPTCSECNYLGQTYEDDSEWPSPSDPCVTCRCQGGHVECQDGRESCNPQCSHPAKPPGQCCPLCDNCLYLDQEYVNGMAFRSPSYDSDCYECHCKNGNVQCYKKHCPPLSCVVSVLVTSECCPKCLDHQVTYATALPAFRVTPSPFDSSYVHETNFFLSTTAFPGVSSSSSSSPSSLPSSSSASLCESCRHTSCSIEGITYKIDESFVHPNNPCQQCTCLESGITCSRVFCPRTPCTHPAMPTDACCPTCQDCLFTQVIYPNATTFTHEDDPCQKCTCKEGNVLCETIKCPTTECSNPKTMDDVCCPICLEPKRCRFHDRFFNYHEIFPHPKDHCQECSCTEGIVTCKERPCPPYACPSPRLKDCCYDCFGCSYAGKTVENYVSFFDPLDPVEPAPASTVE